MLVNMRDCRFHSPLFATAALCLLIVGGTHFTSSLWAQQPQTGLRVGERPGEFEVLDCTGPAAGKTLCYYCRYGRRPVVSVFVRSLDKHIVDLVSQLDRAVERHRDARLAAFVVYLAADPFAAEKQLQALAEQHNIRRTPLTIYRDSPRVLRNQLQISTAAAVTVLMWNDGEVQFHEAFADQMFDDSAIPNVLRGIEQLLSNPTNSEAR